MSKLTQDVCLASTLSYRFINVKKRELRFIFYKIRDQLSGSICTIIITD